MVHLGGHPLSNSWGLVGEEGPQSEEEGTETSSFLSGGGGQLKGAYKKSHQPMVARGLDFKAPVCGKMVACLRLLHRTECSPHEPAYSGLGPHAALPPAWLIKPLRARSGSLTQQLHLGTCRPWPELTAYRTVGSREAIPGSVMVFQVAGSPF